MVGAPQTDWWELGTGHHHYHQRVHRRPHAHQPAVVEILEILETLEILEIHLVMLLVFLGLLCCALSHQGPAPAAQHCPPVHYEAAWMVLNNLHHWTA